MRSADLPPQVPVLPVTVNAGGVRNPNVPGKIIEYDIQRPVTEEERQSIRDFYKTPDLISYRGKGTITQIENEIIDELVLYRRLGAVEGLGYIYPNKVGLQRLPPDLLDKNRFSNNSLDSADLRRYKEAMTKRIGSRGEFLSAIRAGRNYDVDLPSSFSRDDWLYRQFYRYMAIGFAEAYWMDGDFETAIETYQAAGWLNEDCPAAEIIPKKLEEMLLDPEKNQPEEDTVITGHNGAGEQINKRVSPIQRREAAIKIYHFLKKLEGENKFYPEKIARIKTNFAPFFALDIDALQKKIPLLPSD